MADAMVSVAGERLIALIEDEVRFHFNLVRGAEKEVRGLAKELKTIRNVLDDAENRRFQDKNVNSWLSRLEQTSYQMDDVLDEWNYALLKLRMGEHHPDDSAAPRKKVFSFIPSSPCSCFKRTVVRHHIATKILNVKARLDEIFKDKDRYGFVISKPTHDSLPEFRRDQSTSTIYIGDIHGRDREGDILVSKLTAKDGSQELTGISVVSIVGVGGLGKTTLAQLVYNHSRVEECFKLRIWVCVSDPFDLVSIAKAILESMEKGSSQGADQLNVLFNRVREFISGKKFLLVLDDVWTEDFRKWEPLENLLRCSGAGSKILVTTRSRRVAVTMGSRDGEIFQLGTLSDEDCWLVLYRMSHLGRNRKEFEDVGKKIAQKCSGLPLAAKTLGSLLRFKSSLREWEIVLNNEIWGMQEVEDELFRPLLMSYKELSPTQKQCFTYCAFFPKDTEIKVKLLFGHWMALGYLGSNNDDELKVKECFNILAMRSLFQDFKKNDLGEIKSCRMHDIVHDFAMFLKKSGKVEAAEMNKSIPCRVCDPSQVSKVNEFCSLYHVKEKSPPNLCICFVCLRVLSLEGGLKSVPNGMDNLIHLRWLNLEGNELSSEDLKIVFQLYFLQNLRLKSCSLKEIPKEIENLSNLRHLNLSNNDLFKLPSEIGNLIQLRHLNLQGNINLNELPSEIGKLILLQTLKLPICEIPYGIPEELGQLTDLRKLTGLGGSKLGLLNQLGGIVSLEIILNDKDLKGMVEDAREARLSNKIYIQSLVLEFGDKVDVEEESSRMDVLDKMYEEEEESSRMDVIDALVPHPNLRILQIWDYKGSKLPLWIVSPSNQLRKVVLFACKQLNSLPSLEKLEYLEEIHIYQNRGLEFVGRELLGITTNSTSNFVAFPKLKMLVFALCDNWKEWEDITAEEEESPAFQLMPSLTHLQIIGCNELTQLPHHLLRKASSLETLNIYSSEKLVQRYGNKDGPDWKSISRNNPHLQLQLNIG